VVWQDEAMSFETPITREGDTLTGPLRAPAQMLAEQEYGGHTSVHDDATAARLGLAGAPIEGPTHFSQIDPLAVETWGPSWFERGCVSSHFLNMVVEGEQVRATLEPLAATLARIGATKSDGTPVLAGTASIGREDTTELDVRRRRGGEDPGQLYIVDQLEIGMREAVPEPVTMDFDDDNGSLYPFTLAQKLERITERSSWYVPGGASPWGRPIVPTEMISVIAHRSGAHFPVRGPAVGLFIDLEVRFVDGPVFVGQPYRVEHRLVGIGQTTRVESYWTETTLTDDETGSRAAIVLLHQGVFKASYADYPT
jgi:acyl dehydratase